MRGGKQKESPGRRACGRITIYRSSCPNSPFQFYCKGERLTSLTLVPIPLSWPGWLLVRVNVDSEPEFREKEGLLEEACRVGVCEGWRY